MKNIRVLGVDDAYFVPHKGGKTYIVGVVMRASFYIDGFVVREITVDGEDVTDAIASMLLDSKYRSDIKFVMTQGITFGGFNILDIKKLYEIAKKPVIVISRRKPDLDSMFSALKNHFPDWEKRSKLLTEVEIEGVKNGRYTIYIQRMGVDKNTALEIMRKFTIRGAIPEPLRIAHLMASALKLGESKGKP